MKQLPPITLIPADRERLEALAHASLERHPQTAGYLVREIERARMLDDAESGDFVRMGSIVSFRDDTTGQVREVTLTYPDRADIAASRVSVLTPIGAALIGLSKGQKIEWQNPAGEWRPPIIPSLLFVGDVCGKAEEASDFYISLFPESKRGTISRWPQGTAPEQEGSIMFSDFQLAGKWFTAMDSAQQHNFAFNEAVSFMVSCDTQAEIDYYWEKLSAVPEAEQCGWLKDKYGVSWQIVPSVMGEMMSNGTREQIDRVTQAFLPMKKFDIAKLQAAYAGQ